MRAADEAHSRFAARADVAGGGVGSAAVGGVGGGEGGFAVRWEDGLEFGVGEGGVVGDCVGLGGSVVVVVVDAVAVFVGGGGGGVHRCY